MIIVNELPQTGEDDTIYLVPNDNPETQNYYDEYVYVDGEWEKLGGVQVEVDLTDYVKNTDYATGSVGGVFKINTSYANNLNNDGYLTSVTKTMEQYTNAPNGMFVGKGTLENVITGKGLVSDTDYATTQTGGVVKQTNWSQFLVSNGNPYAGYLTYEQYQSANNGIFISKTTLENVLAEKIGTIDTILQTLDTGSGV